MDHLNVDFSLKLQLWLGQTVRLNMSQLRTQELIIRTRNPTVNFLHSLAISTDATLSTSPGYHPIPFLYFIFLVTSDHGSNEHNPPPPMANPGSLEAKILRRYFRAIQLVTWTFYLGSSLSPILLHRAQADLTLDRLADQGSTPFHYISSS